MGDFEAVSNFWGAVVKPDQAYVLDPDHSVTVTFASLGADSSAKDRAILRVHYDDDESPQILGVLRSYRAGIKIDCVCDPGVTATFSLEGAPLPPPAPLDISVDT